ncbi:hypothetical protein DM01DRAFT_1335241 [Hesseltinella vesiculosa]|uniref:THO complex subunit 1 transcription elongation factor-domain-containing protein n=1 Tax=Hesseltinella vesiculosa TaxID=101127 RepID=A0A1X2GJ40_9FUNG|nr:hypothetical protein DM01DRAFT_1335241 [Hesseltinella vesiculosa]
MAMTHFERFKEHGQTALHQILQKIQTSRSDDPSTKISSLLPAWMSTDMTPCCSAEAAQDFGILPGKIDWRKNAMEYILRNHLLDIVKQHPESDPVRFTLLFDVLEIIIALESNQYVEPVIPFTFIEELLDVHSLTSCQSIFEFVESKRQELTVGMVPNRGKALVVLRLCNEMLRRLSKETNTVFCGRIMMFLANSFPLTERSGVNLRGEFNAEPVHYHDEEAIDTDASLTDEQKSFYKTFWATRKFFSNPPSLLSDQYFEEWKKGTQIILDKFQQIADSDLEVAGAKSFQVAGQKRASVAMETDPPDSKVQDLLDEINNDYLFPRLLTSPHLLELQMEDVRFRRNVMLQFLVLFQYLHGFSEDEKQKTKDLLSARGQKVTLVTPTYIVSEENVQWMNEKESEVTNLMRRTKPHGTMYTDIILTVLKHERNMIIWKSSGCPAFEKPPLDIQMLKDARETRWKRLKTVPPGYRFQYGNVEMTNMYGKPKETLKSLLSRRSVPEPVAILDRALQQLELEEDTDPDIRFNIANGALFQATRILFRSHASIIPKIYEIKHNVYYGVTIDPTPTASVSSSEPEDEDMDDNDDKKDMDVDDEEPSQDVSTSDTATPQEPGTPQAKPDTPQNADHATESPQDNDTVQGDTPMDGEDTEFTQDAQDAEDEGEVGRNGTDTQEHEGEIEPEHVDEDQDNKDDDVEETDASSRRTASSASSRSPSPKPDHPPPTIHIPRVSPPKKTVPTPQEIAQGLAQKHVDNEIKVLDLVRKLIMDELQ